MINKISRNNYLMIITLFFFLFGCNKNIQFYNTPLKKIDLIYASKNHFPKQIIKNHKIDTCKIFELDKFGECSYEKIIIFNDQGLVSKSYSYINGQKDRLHNMAYSYNELGNEINRYFRPTGETIYERDSSIYNKSNKIKSKITRSKNGNIKRTHKYKYSNDNLIHIEYIKANGVNSFSNYSYNKEEDNIISIETKFPNHSQHNNKSQYFYNKKGNLIKHTSVDNKNTTLLIHKFYYNNIGLESKFEVYDKGTKLIQVYFKEYDENYLLKKIKSFTNITNEEYTSGEYFEKIFIYTSK